MRMKMKVFYNNKAETSGVMIFFGMMLGLMLWIAFTQMLGPATDAVADARAVTGLDCGNTSITQGTKGTCVLTDWMVFGWAGAVIAAIIGAAGGGLFYKITKKPEAK